MAQFGCHSREGLPEDKAKPLTEQILKGQPEAAQKQMRVRKNSCGAQEKAFRGIQKANSGL